MRLLLYHFETKALNRHWIIGISSIKSKFEALIIEDYRGFYMTTTGIKTIKYLIKC